MNNCIILGSGRSGTSMLAGTLSKAGYYMGANLYSGRAANPKGFFEDPELNAINEELIAQVETPWQRGVVEELLKRVCPYFSNNSRIARKLNQIRPAWGQRWLTILPPGPELVCTPAIARRIRRQTSRKPFCFKDPRFCYTLPVWRPFVPEDTVYVCVFREPQKTAHSILKECQDAEYLRTLPMDFSKATTVWTMMYSHVLEIHRYIGNWLFVHYDQVLNGSAIPKLEATLGVHIDRQFLDPGLKRSQGDGRIGLDTLNIYNRLCELAEYPDNR